MKKNKYGYPPPTNRLEFEHNMYLVEEDTTRKARSGDDELIKNVAIATWPHLKELKRLPNGRINLLTINEQLRLQGNMRKWREIDV